MKDIQAKVQDRTYTILTNMAKHHGITIDFLVNFLLEDSIGRMTLEHFDKRIENAKFMVDLRERGWAVAEEEDQGRSTADHG